MHSKGIVNSNIGLINYDELIHAGGYLEKPNPSFYLNNNATFWTMSPSGLSQTATATDWSVYSTGAIRHYRVDIKAQLRPVINLKPDVTVTGTGASDNHYVVQ